MALHMMQMRALDSDALQVLEGVLAGTRQAFVGWVREGEQWKFKYSPLSLQDFAESVVALRAAARCVQLEKSEL